MIKSYVLCGMVQVLSKVCSWLEEQSLFQVFFISELETPFWMKQKVLLRHMTILIWSFNKPLRLDCYTTRFLRDILIKSSNLIFTLKMFVWRLKLALKTRFDPFIKYFISSFLFQFNFFFRNRLYKPSPSEHNNLFTPQFQHDSRTNVSCQKSVRSIITFIIELIA